MHFFNLVRDLRARGVGIIYISHALEESLKISDRITVLRDGKLVITARPSEMTREKLVRYMVGRDIAQTHYAPHASRGRRRRHRRGEKVLVVENVTMGAVVKNMSFSVYAGEVVGIAGLIGSGRTEIAQDHFRRAEAQPDQWRHDLSARQADPLPRAQAGDRRRDRLHHRRPQAQRLLRDDAHRRQYLPEQARDQARASASCCRAPRASKLAELLGRALQDRRAAAARRASSNCRAAISKRS